MKVLHIIDSLGLGGAQTLLRGIFENQKENNNIFLFSLRRKEINIGIKNKNIFSCNSESKYSFKAIKELKEIIEENNIKIIHCHLFRSQVFGFILKKIYFPKIKLLIHGHDKISRGNSFFLKAIKKDIDLFIAVSNFVRDDLIRIGTDKEKITTLYNFVELERFKKKNTFEDKFIIGFSGRIIKRKGWREIIEAIKILERSFPEIKLFIAGEGRERKKLLRLIKKYSLQDRVKYMGYISDMTSFYSSLNYILIPSHFEPGITTLVESWAMGVPAIISKTYAFDEVVINYRNGLFFEKKSYNDLAKKMEELFINNNLREEIIKGGLEEAKKYNIDKYIKKINLIYERLSFNNHS